MVFDVLRKLELDGCLGRCHLIVSDQDTPSGSRTILGSELTRISRRHIEFLGGESLYELIRYPLEKISEIRLGGKPVYRKRKAVKRIFMRK